MSDLPCKNPSCKSNGIPHPNCQCYDFAEGGEVSHFCEIGRAHKKDCQYYADGGAVEEPTMENTTPIEAAEEVPAIENTTPIEEEEPTWENTTPIEGIEEEPTWENTTGIHETTGQQILTGVEGAARGLLGPLATGAEMGLSAMGVPGISAEEISARQAANPGIATIGETAGLAAGFIPALAPFSVAGKAARVSKAVQVAEAASTGAKIGAAALRGVINGGLIQTSDEISKAMLGQGDPTESVAGRLVDAGGNVLGAGAIMGAFGALGGATSQVISKAAELKLGNKIFGWLSGIGEAMQGKAGESPARLLDPKSYDKGATDWIKKVMIPASGGAMAYKAQYDAHKAWDKGDLEGGLTDLGVDLAMFLGLKYGGGPLLRKISKPAGAFLINMISNGENNPRVLIDGINYANKAASGAQKINRSVENLFSGASQKIFNEDEMSKARNKLDEYISNGGINQEINQSEEVSDEDPVNFAEGGPVEKAQKASAIETHLPEQSMLISAAQSRMSNYLQQIRPQENGPKLSFDSNPDQTSQKKKYKKALDMAIQPLSIMDKIKKGTIDMDDMTNFNGMHPELYGVLQKKVTENIIKDQLKGKKPNYKMRQGLSLFMGTALSSEFLPQNIAAAQAVFKSQTAQPQETKGSATRTKAISKSSQSYLTKNQASASRQQRQ